jgi:hypothetical protein
MREGEGVKPTATRGLVAVDRPAKGTPNTKKETPSRRVKFETGFQWVFFIRWFRVVLKINWLLVNCLN